MTQSGTEVWKSSGSPVRLSLCINKAPIRTSLITLLSPLTNGPPLCEVGCMSDSGTNFALNIDSRSLYAHPNDLLVEFQRASTSNRACQMFPHLIPFATSPSRSPFRPSASGRALAHIPASQEPLPPLGTISDLKVAERHLISDRR